jgi:hypothetical protein
MANKLASIFFVCLTVFSANSTEPSIVLLESTPKWKDIFNQSEVVTLIGRNKQQLPGVTVHFRTNTIYEMTLHQPSGDVSNLTAPSNLWDAIRAWTAIGMAKFLERPVPDTIWTAITTPNYHGKVGKANADGEILEYDGYLVPLCIFAAHTPGITPSKYLFDDVVTHDSHLQCVKPFIQQVGETFRITDHGGPFEAGVTQLALNVFAGVHGDCNSLVDVWFEPNLDRLLPKLSANPLPD